MPKLRLMVSLVVGLAWLPASACQLGRPMCPVPQAVLIPAHLCTGRWCTVPPARMGNSNNLAAVAAVSSADVWAVGSTATGSGRNGCPEGPPDLGQPTPLIERWDGRRWTVVPVPRIQGSLDAVAAAGPDHAWAAGGSLLLRWDGTSWKVAPWPVSKEAEIFGMAAVSSGDVWAVGADQSGTRERPAVAHWDGTRWSLIQTPAARGAFDANTSLYGVSARSTDDVWAVGTAETGGGTAAGPERWSTLVEHWNGRRWRVVPSPDYPGLGRSELHAVVAVSPDDVWAGGTRGRNCCDGLLTLIEHWDGTRWTIVSSPNHGGDNGVASIAAVSSTDVWALGSDGSGTMTLHWDGARWRLEPSPDIPTAGGSLSDAVATPDGEVWAVGSRGAAGAKSQSLILRLRP